MGADAGLILTQVIGGDVELVVGSDVLAPSEVVTVIIGDAGDERVG